MKDRDCIVLDVKNMMMHLKDIAVEAERGETDCTDAVEHMLQHTHNHMMNCQPESLMEHLKDIQDSIKSGNNGCIDGVNHILMHISEHMIKHHPEIDAAKYISSDNSCSFPCDLL